MEARILVIGELNVDLIMSGLSSAPKLGTEVLAQEFRMALGSASAIYACGMATLGYDVTFISKVGMDQFGRFCLDALEHAHISTAGVLQSKESTTGVTIVLSTREDRALVTCLGAIAELRYADVQQLTFSGHTHLHLTSYFLQQALRPDILLLIHQAKRAGLTLSFDPNSDPAEQWTSDIEEIFTKVDILFLNETEALAATRQTEVREALRVLQRHQTCVVIKLGRNGAIGSRDGEIVHAPGYPVDVVDTTGAGDSFAAGFVHGMLLGRDLVTCLRFGNAAGALSTRGQGGTASQADQFTLEQFLRDKAQPDLPT